jgi:hypothetical protein
MDFAKRFITIPLGFGSCAAHTITATAFKVSLKRSEKHTAPFHCDLKSGCALMRAAGLWLVAYYLLLTAP